MANLSDDVFFATISELGAKLRAREFSSVELTRAYCDRLEKIGPKYNALALSLRKQALRQARDADDELRHDRIHGPLEGIPFGAKDLLAVKGHPTTWGAKPYATQVFDQNAQVIQKLGSARAVLIGKLAMVELAGGGGYQSANASLTGPGLNPWDPSRWSGGSSSGSGSAVAAGLVGFALGSETSGSILTPSAYCGITGLRPTYGLVSRRGAMPLSWTMDKIGPMCRSADDCGLVLHAIAGADPQDPGSAGRGFSYAPEYSGKPEELNIGYAPVDFDEWPGPSARAGFQAALGVMKSLGAKMREVEIPDFPYAALATTIILAEGATVFEELIRSGKVDQLADRTQIAGLKAGLEIPATEYLKAMRIRSLVQQAFEQMFIDVDVLLTPSRFNTATKIAEPIDGGNASGRSQPKSHGLNGMVQAGNLAGLPALSLPCGFADQMPIAISLVGRPFSENHLLVLGRAFQSHTDWHRRRPPVVSQ